MTFLFFFLTNQVLERNARGLDQGRMWTGHNSRMVQIYQTWKQRLRILRVDTCGALHQRWLTSFEMNGWYLKIKPKKRDHKAYER